MTYNYSKLSFDHFDYMGKAAIFNPSPVRERKRKREEKDTPNYICVVLGETVETQEGGKSIEPYFIKNLFNFTLV